MKPTVPSRDEILRDLSSFLESEKFVEAVRTVQECSHATHVIRKDKENVLYKTPFGNVIITGYHYKHTKRKPGLIYQPHMKTFATIIAIQNKKKACSHETPCYHVTSQRLALTREFVESEIFKLINKTNLPVRAFLTFGDEKLFWESIIRTYIYVTEVGTNKFRELLNLLISCSRTDMAPIAMRLNKSQLEIFVSILNQIQDENWLTFSLFTERALEVINTSSESELEMDMTTFLAFKGLYYKTL